jgi:hypothetical protein
LSISEKKTEKIKGLFSQQKCRKNESALLGEVWGPMGELFLAFCTFQENNKATFTLKLIYA